VGGGGEPLRSPYSTLASWTVPGHVTKECDTHAQLYVQDKEKELLQSISHSPTTIFFCLEVLKFAVTGHGFF
jgi:hypothetical protein